MSKELPVAHCPGCGKVFQKNLRNMCMQCSAEEDGQIIAIERALKNDRQLSNAETAELTAIPEARIRALIRRGRLRLYDYPNLADACDLCAAPIRQGKLCLTCLMRLKDDIEQDREKARLKKEHVFLTKQRR
ncbi:hypothetical protein [Paenibacillus glycinis]|uniref:Flagellar protein n=1 Tax=Paenibacillus glycinis TaxID=2697035 RepID=A0ABW9XNU7_9BACL|nr:hypothetical protein [Paenibacillus glycinis]NBD24308.1 hypothetical protein [Paenibacillus glycinis]